MEGHVDFGLTGNKENLEKRWVDEFCNAIICGFNQIMYE